MRFSKSTTPLLQARPLVLSSLFCDEQDTGKRHKVLKLPPTTTGYQVSNRKVFQIVCHVLLYRAFGMQGVISIKTLTELARMRKAGIKLVLITGARVSTLLQRMAYLPAADAYICENGGRIFYPDNTLPLALPIAEDVQWRNKHNATGMVFISTPKNTSAMLGWLLLLMACTSA